MVANRETRRLDLSRPRMQITGPVLDSADPIALAEFYARLLGWEIVAREGPRPGYPPSDGWAKLRSPDGELKLEFQWEEHYAPPRWPAARGEQQMMMHLDIGVVDPEEGVAWAIEQGATVAEHQPQNGVRVVLDPAGHPFCLFADSTLGS
jgi:catechol 2,3-dioxygenase-like lactoylglutathione lyase family enzyme